VIYRQVSYAGLRMSCRSDTIAALAAGLKIVINLIKTCLCIILGVRLDLPEISLLFTGGNFLSGE